MCIDECLIFQNMTDLEFVVAELAKSFDKIVQESLNEADVKDEEKELISERFSTAFKDNMKLGLVTVFGVKETAPSQTPVKTEVSIEDVIKQGLQYRHDYLFNKFLFCLEEALLRVVGRRRRYPRNASALLGMTLKKNRNMLKGLKVNITKEKLDLSGITTASSEDMDRDFQKVGSILEDSKVLAAQNSDKLDRIIESYKILRNSVTNSIK